MKSVSYVTCIDLIAQVSLIRWSLLFLDVLTLKLRIIIIILPTDRPETILPGARTTKNKLPSPNIKFSEESSLKNCYLVTGCIILVGTKVETKPQTNAKSDRVRLNRSSFVIHDEILNFHDWILCYHELFHKMKI